jgi:hypothetical protein
VHPELAAMLAEWRESGWVEFFGKKPEAGDLVVPNQAGRHLTDNNVNGIRDLDFERLQMRRRWFHHTRRTFFTRAQTDGAPRDVVYAITHNPGDVSRDMAAQYTSFPWATLCAAVRGLAFHRHPPQGRPTSLPTPAPEGVESMKTTEETSCPRRDSNSTSDATVGSRLRLLPSVVEPPEEAQKPPQTGDRRNVGTNPIPDLPARLRRLVAQYGGGAA